MPNSQRVDQISQMILESDADIVALQEVSDLSDGYRLYDKLKSKYSDFYFNAGATPFILQNNSGLFVASKVPVEDVQFEDFSSVPGTESMVNKGGLWRGPVHIYIN